MPVAIHAEMHCFGSQHCWMHGSWGWAYKGSQTMWLKTTEIYFPTVLESRNPKSWCLQGLGEDLSQGYRGRSDPCHSLKLLAILSIPWLLETWFQSSPPSLPGVPLVCLSSHGILFFVRVCLCVSSLLPLEDTTHQPNDLILT